MVTERVRRVGSGNEGPHIGHLQRGRSRCPRLAVCFVSFVFFDWGGGLCLVRCFGDRLVCLVGLSDGMCCLTGCVVWLDVLSGGMCCLLGCSACGMCWVWGDVLFGGVGSLAPRCGRVWGPGWGGVVVRNIDFDVFC